MLNRKKKVLDPSTIWNHIHVLQGQTTIDLVCDYRCKGKTVGRAHKTEPKCTVQLHLHQVPRPTPTPTSPTPLFHLRPAAVRLQFAHGSVTVRLPFVYGSLTVRLRCALRFAYDSVTVRLLSGYGSLTVLAYASLAYPLFAPPHPTQPCPYPRFRRKRTFPSKKQTSSSASSATSREPSPQCEQEQGKPEQSKTTQGNANRAKQTRAMLGRAEQSTAERRVTFGLKNDFPYNKHTQS